MDVLRVGSAVAVAVAAPSRPGTRDELHRSDRSVPHGVTVELPAVGAALAAGAIVGEVESTKSVGELYAPLAGEVVEANQGVVDAPETINADPYGEGWLVKLRVSEPPALMTADDYRTLISA